MKSKSESIVTEEEIELLIEEGREDGTIEKEEEDIIKRVLKDIPCAGVGQTVVIVPFADKLKAYLFGQQKLILL